MSFLYEIKDLSFLYANGEKAVDIKTLKLKKGKITVLSGGNGSGKTTLLKLLSGILKPSSGEIINSNVKPVISFLPQNALLLKRSVYKNVEYGLNAAGVGYGRKKIKESLQLVGLDYSRFADRMWYELSGGEQKRVALAARIALNPDVLILDEVCENIDPAAEYYIGDALLKIVSKTGASVILSSHNMGWASLYGDEFFTMINGGIYKGPYLNVVDRHWASINDGDSAEASSNKEPALTVFGPEKLVLRKYNESSCPGRFILGEIIKYESFGKGMLIYHLKSHGRRLFASSTEQKFSPGDKVCILFMAD